MFKVYEMMGNKSKEVAMFETEDEAIEYVSDNASQNTVEELGVDIANDDVKAYEVEYENQVSYFAIEDDKRELIDESRLEEMYCEALDEEGEIKIGYLTFYPSNVLEKCDPIAYNCGLSDFYDAISDQYYCEGME